MSAVRWARNRSEAAKMDNFFTECSVGSDILNSNDTKTGDLERRMQLLNVRKLQRPRMWDAHRSAF